MMEPLLVLGLIAIAWVAGWLQGHCSGWAEARQLMKRKKEGRNQ